MSRRVAALVLLVSTLLLQACGPKISDGLPAAAWVHISGEPQAALTSMVLRLRNSDQEVLMQVAIAEGERVIAVIDTLPGSVVLTSSLGCEIALALESAVETDVLVEHEPESCLLRVVDHHEPGQQGHALATATILFRDGSPPADVTVTAVSLDTIPNPVPSPARRDEGGRLHFTTMIPGRYRFIASAGDMVFGIQDADIRPEPASNEVTIQLGS